MSKPKKTKEGKKNWLQRFLHRIFIAGDLNEMCSPERNKGNGWMRFGR